ncbi:MAG: hypothetical protein IPI73_17570 [Betaproteobacteria bacterium]|nr:hypothetical protein [Betaproteobacteria bacterium]
MSSLSLSARDTPDMADTPIDEDRIRRLADLLLEVARTVDPELAASVPSNFEGDPRLEALRSVLLEHDRAAFARLQQKVDDPQEFAEAGSAVLASAFDLAATRDERLARYSRRRWSARRRHRSARIPRPWSASSTR